MAQENGGGGGRNDGCQWGPVAVAVVEDGSRSSDLKLPSLLGTRGERQGENGLAGFRFRSGFQNLNQNVGVLLIFMVFLNSLIIFHSGNMSDKPDYRTDCE